MKNYRLSEELGNIDEVFLEEVFEYSMNKRRISMSKTKLLAIAVAAIIFTSLLTGAASVASLMSDETAKEIIIAAENYIVMNADPDEKGDLGSAFIGGLGYDGEVVSSEAYFEFSGLKPIYNVSVKLGGYTYSLVLDAKTKEVLSCDRTVDEGWEAHLDEVRKERAKNRNYKSDIEVDSIKRNDVVYGDISGTKAQDIVCDYLGNDDCEFMTTAGSAAPNYATNPASSFVRVSHAGYVYEALVDSVSGEILHLETFAIADGYDLWYTSNSDDNVTDRDIHIHEHSDDEREFIGRIKAKWIAEEYFSADERNWSISDFIRYEVGHHTQTNEIVIADLGFPEDLDYYYEGMAFDSGDLKLIFIDARTGEILAICDSNPS